MAELISQLKEILSEEFTDEEGKPYRAQLLPALSPVEITALAARVPTAALPQDIEELLLYSRGIELGWLEEIQFDTFGEFGLAGLFPACIELTHDGAGNYWVLDINRAGQWGPCFTCATTRQ